MALDQTANGRVGWWTFLLSLQSAVILVAFWVGVYTGSTDVEPVNIRLGAHERIEVHDGAVRRQVYEAEQRELRAQINDLFRRLERLEDRRAN